MPQRDSIHSIVKQSLINEGWEVTDDPYVISYGERFLFVDLGATSTTDIDQGKFIAAKRQGRKIAVEIKELRGKSVIKELEQAIGQYVLYKLLINKIEPERDIYLAITDIIYDEIFTEPIGELVINDLPLQVIVIDPKRMEVIRWISH